MQEMLTFFPVVRLSDTFPGPVPALPLSVPKERAPAKGAPAMHIIPCKCKKPYRSKGDVA